MTARDMNPYAEYRTLAPCDGFDIDGLWTAMDLWLQDQESAEAEYGYINRWDTCGIKKFDNLFMWAHDFNDNISQWDTGRSTSMYGMFMFASSFEGDLSGWDVAATRDMSGMFWAASSFNGDLSGWDVAATKDMTYMFMGASNFNRCLAWDVRGKDTDEMFSGSNGRRCPTNSPTDAPTLTTPPSPIPTTPPSSIPTTPPSSIPMTLPTSIPAPASAVNAVAAGAGAGAVIAALLLIWFFIFKRQKNRADKDDFEIGTFWTETKEDKHAAAFLVLGTKGSKVPHATDSFRAKSSAPPPSSCVFADDDPFAAALRSVDRLSFAYLEEPSDASALALRDALAAAVVLCDDDAGGNPPDDLPSALEGVLFGDTLMYLAGLSRMYLELGSRPMFSSVRAALVVALAQCEALPDHPLELAEEVQDRQRNLVAPGGDAVDPDVPEEAVAGAASV
mmetsp:Transcript_22450/g.45005  ORF Transcript_22450/g.45005 Transcript_22450/m.45005 type:complete len:448 (+) Transcript_22450:228-1571(+)